MMQQRSFTEKLALTLGVSSAAMAPVPAGAWLATYDNQLITGNWDVDGDGTPEFKFHTYRTTQLGDVYVFYLDSGSGFNGRGFVNQNGGGGFATLASSVAVGATLAAPYQWGSVRSQRAIAGSFFPDNTYWIAAGSPTEDNAIAFRFDSGAGMQYGWAVLRYDRFGLVPRPFIAEWTYNTAPGEQVHVGSQAPVPPSIIPALTLLGLGAAGIRRMRKRQESAADHEA